MKKENKLNVSSVIVFVIWLLVLGITGVIYYSCVYGSDSGKVVGVHAASEYVEDEADKDIFEGKVIVGVGDSIMRGAGCDDTPLTKQIAEEHNMRYQDFSRSGATVIVNTRKNKDLTLNILEQVKLLVEQVEYTDFVLFNGGTNDTNDRVINNKLGTITEDFDTKRNVSTYCGAFEEIIAILKEKYPNAAIVYVRAHNMERKDYKQQLIIGEESIKMCNKWGIGYADVFNDSDMNTYLDRYKIYTLSKKKYPGGDMIHPTREGYKLFYIPLIEKAFEDIVCDK